MAALLPAYYRWGVALSAVALAALLAGAAWARPERPRQLAAAVLSAVMLALLAWALAVTLPAAEAARRTRDDARFAAAHRNAVRLNVAVMLCAAGALVVAGFIPTRRRNG